MNDEIVLKMKERYVHLPPIIWQRSVERAKDEAELFDILETIPKIYPLVWENSTRRWITGPSVPSPSAAPLNVGRSAGIRRVSASCPAAGSE